MVNSCSSHKTVIVYDFQDITRNHTQYKLYYAALYRPVRLRQDLTAGVTSGARGWDELFIYFFYSLAEATPSSPDPGSRISDGRRPRQCVNAVVTTKGSY